MAFGWMGRILDIDLSAGTIGTRDTMAYADDYIGGRALAARIAWDEIPPGIDAFDARNRIIIATGPLTGTLAPTSGRTVMSGISPRTMPMAWYTHSTLGGWFGPELKYVGFDGIVISGASEQPVYIEITDGTAQLVDATDLWGLDAYETQMYLRERLGGASAQAMTIGPAGENRVRLPRCSTPRRTPPAIAALARCGAARTSRRSSCGAPDRSRWPMPTLCFVRYRAPEAINEHRFRPMWTKTRGQIAGRCAASRVALTVAWPIIAAPDQAHHSHLLHRADLGERGFHVSHRL